MGLDMIDSTRGSFPGPALRVAVNSRWPTLSSWPSGLAADLTGLRPSLGGFFSRRMRRSLNLKDYATLVVNDAIVSFYTEELLQLEVEILD